MPENKEYLTGIVKARETVRRTLSGVQDSFEDTGDAINEAAAAAEGSQAAFEGVERAAIESGAAADVSGKQYDDLSEDLREAAISAGALRTSLADMPSERSVRVDTEVDETPGIPESEETATIHPSVDRSGLSRARSTISEALPDRHTTRVGTQVDQPEIDTEPETATIRTEVDRSALDRARSTVRETFEDIRSTVRVDTQIEEAGLSEIEGSQGGGRTRKIGVKFSDSEARDALDRFRASIRSMPDLNIDADSTSGLVDNLSHAQDELTQVRTTLDRLDTTDSEATAGIDIQDSSSVTQLRERLELIDDSEVSGEVSVATQRAVDALDGLSDESRQALDDSIAASGGLSELQDSIDETADESGAGAAALSGLESEIDGLDNTVSEAVSLSDLSSRIDELGEESAETERDVDSLTRALRSFVPAATAAAGASATVGASMPDSRAMSGFSTGVLGIKGSLTSMLPILAVLATLIPGLISGLGGVAAAGIGVSGALAGLFAGGLLKRGEQLAQTSSEIEDKFAGAKQILENFKSELKSALEPLQNVEGVGSFSLDVLQGAIGVVRDLSRAGAELAPILLPMADRLMQVADAAGSETIDELVATVKEFAPEIEALIGGALRLLPDILRAIRSDARQLLPALASVTQAAVRLAPVLADMGVVVATVLLPALAGAMDVLSAFAPLAALVAQVTSAIPIEVWEVLGAAITGVGVAISALALPVLASGLWAATTAAGAFVAATLPISGTVLAIAAAIGAVVGALLWLSQNLEVAREAWAGFVDFAANSVQTVVDGVYSMVNGAIAALEGLRETANKLLPKKLEIKSELQQVGEAPEIGDDVRRTGKVIGDMGAEALGGEKSRPGAKSSPAAAGSRGPSTVVQGDLVKGNKDNSKLLEVEGDSDERRVERAIEDALDRSNSTRSAR